MVLIIYELERKRKVRINNEIIHVTLSHLKSQSSGSKNQGIS